VKKRNFLMSVAVIAAAMSLDASAGLPKSLMEHTSSNVSSALPVTQISTANTPFVLERPISTATGKVQHSYHSSHASHSSHNSHSSHYSSRF
jgi:hypothetical protein